MRRLRSTGRAQFMTTNGDLVAWERLTGRLWPELGDLGCRDWRFGDGIKSSPHVIRPSHRGSILDHHPRLASGSQQQGRSRLLYITR